MKTFVLLMSCPDQPGIVARTTGLLYEAGCNIRALEQHTEDGELFFMRIEADVVDAHVPFNALHDQLDELAGSLNGTISVHDREVRPRVAVLVSKEDACLYELLSKQRSGEIHSDIALVIGNHDDLRPVAEAFGVPFEHVPNGEGIGGAHEQKILELLEKHKVELVVLARYMKILSGDFVSKYPQRIINIHHGFLPAFKGAQPYRQAWERGVKIIGATAHFVTADLDEGPIIAQDVTSITHQYSVSTMVETGRDIEKSVLVRAVKAAVEHRIILHGRRTVVFNP